MKNQAVGTMKKPTFTIRLLMLLIVVFAGFTAITTFSIHSLKAALFEEKAQQTRFLVENAHSLLGFLEDLSARGLISEEEAKQRAIDTLQSLRYDTDNYFWINDKTPKMIAHPYSMELIGQDLSQTVDANGKYLFNELVDIVNTQGEGIIPYLWPKPGQTEPVEKISYVKLFTPWDWIVGSGVYVDDVEVAFKNSVVFLSTLSAGITLLVLTGALIIRREAAFQAAQYNLIEDTNTLLEHQVAERTAALQQANHEVNASRDKAIKEKQKLEYSEAVFRGMAETAQDAIILIDDDGLVVYWNASAERIFSYSAEEVQGKDLHAFVAMEPEQLKFRAAFPKFLNSGRSTTLGKVLELTAIRKSGEQFPVELSISRILIGDSRQALGIVRDISDRKESEQALINKADQQAKLIAQLQATQDQLLQSEKLAAIGQLSAGVAHEINNPVGFIGSNINSAKSYVDQLISMLELIKTKTSSLDNSAEVQQVIEAVEHQYEFDYLKRDLADLFIETKDGVARIQKIVADLKGFARASDGVWEKVDLNKEIDSTLNVIWNELKYHCTIVKQYGDLPIVECLRSEVNQVIMNLLINASHAIADKGTIWIRTGADQDYCWILIEDNGKGIDPKLLHKIFDPFFTTKPVGKGTGLGLSVSYGIVEKHSGKLEVSSTPGVGTTLTLKLPINRSTTC